MPETLIEYPDPDACLMHLLRHGATPPNLLDPPIMQGDGINEPLAELGHRQAARARAALSDRPLTAVYSSPLHRAMETAQVVAEPHRLAVQPVDGVVEVGVGSWEGLTWPEVERDQPEAYRAFRENPAEHGYPGGETLLGLAERVTSAFAELMVRHRGEEIAVVAHSVVNRVYLGQLLGLSLAAGRGIKQANCAINVVEWRGGRPRAVTVNAIGHLM